MSDAWIIFFIYWTLIVVPVLVIAIAKTYAEWRRTGHATIGSSIFRMPFGEPSTHGEF